jgi:hypothetical protein
VFDPKKGVTRVAGFFKMYMHLSLRKSGPHKTNTIFRIPYRRDLYPSEVALGVLDNKEKEGHAIEWLEAQVNC